MSFARARRVADALLYEGYILYPYRASSRKNRYRWTFGVLVPRAWSERGGERASLRLECLVEADAPPVVEGLLRFLHVERRAVERAEGDGFVLVEEWTVSGEQHITWEEACARELPFRIAAPCAPSRLLDARLEGSEEVRALHEDGAQVGRVIRRRRPLALALTASAEHVVDKLYTLRITVENQTPLADADVPREEAVASSLVGAHLLLSVAGGGGFVSLLDPPDAWREAAAGCRGDGVYPVLAGAHGDRSLLLASPIALYDHPELAPESPGETFDGTEIDELLTLSTLSLTDDEKREARATDPRAAALLARAENLSADAMLALHGARRDRPNAAANAAACAATDGAFDFADERPARHAFGRGARVRIRLPPMEGPRRTDAQDMFLQGRVGVVEDVLEDVDDKVHVAVILEDDPAADLHRWYGRHLHFRPEELELLEAAP